ncbi:hypothetical protein DNTS_026219, partial [Danionella cerebrum]
MAGLCRHYHCYLRQQWCKWQSILADLREDESTALQTVSALRASVETSSNGAAKSVVFSPPGSGDSSKALMEAERSGGIAGGANQSTSGSGAGRNPNGPKTVLGPAAAMAAPMAGSSQLRDPQEGEAGLSLPGILHFIQYEWSRFQTEKYRWEAERDELRTDFWRKSTFYVTEKRQKSRSPAAIAQVAFLQGERKGQENMKQDLVRRIKMLEYALKQERTKHQKLKSGTDHSAGEKKPETEAEQIPNGPANSDIEGSNQMPWKEGRQLLRKYLEEVGYSDTILDMRSKRVRSLLGRSSPEVNGPPPPQSEGHSEAEPHGAGESLLVRQIEEQIK